jgi:hypothetical protein
MALVATEPGASFSPSGILRLDLDDDQRGEILETARRVLLEIGTTD